MSYDLNRCIRNHLKYLSQHKPNFEIFGKSNNYIWDISIKSEFKVTTDFMINKNKCIHSRIKFIRTAYDTNLHDIVLTSQVRL